MGHKGKMMSLAMQRDNLSWKPLCNKNSEIKGALYHCNIIISHASTYKKCFFIISNLGNRAGSQKL